MTVHIYLREALSARFPSVNFTPYFAFIESLPQTDRGHRHHILPKKEFPEFSKDQNNLIRLSPADHFMAHYWLAVCAPEFEMVFYLMANRKHAYQISKDKLFQYAEVYERGRIKQIEYIRILGRSGVGGRKNVESGHIQALGRKNAENGRIQGHKNVENGVDFAAMGRKGGHTGGLTSGRKNVESGHIQALGRIQGRKNAENDHLRKLGKIQGRKNVENGHLASIRNLKNQIKGGQSGGHTQWHVKRGITNPNCGLCHA